MRKCHKQSSILAELIWPLCLAGTKKVEKAEVGREGRLFRGQVSGKEGLDLKKGTKMK